MFQWFLCAATSSACWVWPPCQVVSWRTRGLPRPLPHTPNIAFRHLPPKEGCRKPELGVCLYPCRHARWYPGCRAARFCSWSLRNWTPFRSPGLQVWYPVPPAGAILPPGRESLFPISSSWSQYSNGPPVDFWRQ